MNNKIPKWFYHILLHKKVKAVLLLLEVAYFVHFSYELINDVTEFYDMYFM